MWAGNSEKKMEVTQSTLPDNGVNSEFLSIIETNQPPRFKMINVSVCMKKKCILIIKKI